MDGIAIAIVGLVKSALTSVVESLIVEGAFGIASRFRARWMRRVSRSPNRRPPAGTG